MSDIGKEMDSEMLVCNVDLFQRSYLPFVPVVEDVNTCIEELKEAGLLVQQQGEPLQWSAFRNKPSKAKENETEVFAGIDKIAQRLACCALPSSTGDNRYFTPRIEYRDCPNKHIASEITGANFRNDGCFMLNPASDLFSPSDILATPNIVVLAEYKKDLSGESDVSKCTPVLNHSNDTLRTEPLKSCLCSKSHHE